MCCRYFIDEHPVLDSLLEQVNRSPLAEQFTARTGKAVKQSGEVFPMDVAPVVATGRSGGRAAFPMRWGFSGRTPLFNARVETAAVKPLFREAFASHRCAVPALWYFEWEHLLLPGGKKKTGDKYLLRPIGEQLTWLAGIYRMEDGLPVYTVLTREPSDSIRFIHDRMPLILPESRIDEWIAPGTRPESVLPSALTELEYARA